MDVLNEKNLDRIMDLCAKKDIKLDSNEIDKVKALFNTGDDQKIREENILKAKTMLFRSILPPEASQKHVQIAGALIVSVDQALKHQINFWDNDLSDETKNYYLRFFSPDSPIKMDILSQTLEPREIVDSLDKIYPTVYDNLLDRVRPYIKENMPDEGAAMFLRLLPFEAKNAKRAGRFENAWYYDFLEACSKHGYTSMLPRFIDSNFKDDLLQYKLKTTRKKVEDFTMADLMREEDYLIPHEPRDQKNFKNFREISAETLMSMADPALYELRPYQNELVSNALSGKNTIICAPTGSGKTVVAVDIIMKHLKSYREERKVARVVMFVPTVPLVNQQTIRLVEYMRGTYWIDGLSGAEVVPTRCGVVLAADVVVMTPQIFINMMNSVVKGERLYISDFTMFIFDECHHCDEAHPYKILMDSVHDFKGPKPQIIGLTASLGIGANPRSQAACADHLIKMCANLNAECISTVQKHESSLLQYVQPPEDVVLSVSRPTTDEFANLIKQNMLIIQMEMTPMLKEIQQSKAVILRPDEIGIPKDPMSTNYQTIVGTLRSKLTSLADASRRHKLLRAIDHLRFYYHALALNDLLPSSYAFKYLEEKMSHQKQVVQKNEFNLEYMKKYEDIREDLLKLTRHENIETKGILKHLHEQLDNQYKNNNMSRTLIFVTTRAGAQLLADYLNKTDKLPHLHNGKQKVQVVGFVTSSNQSASASGQSNEMQREMLQKFDTGSIKVLVATSVAEEGLDISACNLIIKYNNVGSERSLIQRRGRARARDSKSVLLAVEGAVAQQEFQNMRSEALMHKTIKELQHESQQHLLSKIQTKIEVQRKNRELEEMRKAEKRRELEDRRYLLKCCVCSARICESRRIRALADDKYVCCDPEFWKRCNIKDDEDPKKAGVSTICGKIYCKCGQLWGTVIRYSNVFLPALVSNYFIMERFDREDLEAGHVSNKKTWRLIEQECFNIARLDDNNLREMYNALKQIAADQYERMEQQEQIANQRALDRYEEKRAARKERPKVILLDD
uniref:RNA helicase n=1 Tax=Acrobeloides nanus TaxID=290746 RepID=A0A914CMZ3_9BILA